ncbi:hypothetical protein [Pseudomonas nitroreducens]|uniref:hypothetical protein n=1 Tax=Pseudomonas nitroreducens TaxID=46680 RepID=UPI002D80CA3B|nr:hypothetical protein [Pseudomonas nitroreducens]
MDCLVCLQPAEELATGGDYRRINCPNCGEYKLTGTLEKVMGGRRFNVDGVRDHFTKARLNGEVPTLSDDDKKLLL